MLEDSVSAIPSSIWASMNSWFTPTVLFVLLNVILATIALTSTAQKQHQNQPRNEPGIARSPSLLHRLKSMNLHPHNLSVHHDPTQVSQEILGASEAPHLFDESPQRTETRTRLVAEQNDRSLDDFPAALDEKVEDNDLESMDEVYSKLAGGHFGRRKSGAEAAPDDAPARLPARMMKSASAKSAFGHLEEAEIVEARRPATVRERGKAAAPEDDEEVDARADDFINKFRQQLKLQRLDSITRYKRGSGGL